MSQMPDKICVAPHQITDYDLDIQEIGHNGAEEYIRKDVVDDMLATAEDHAYFAGSENTREKPTDAFIEKACMKLKKLMYDSLMFQGRLERGEVIDNFVEDFKNYMKGE